MFVMIDGHGKSIKIAAIESNNKKIITLKLVNIYSCRRLVFGTRNFILYTDTSLKSLDQVSTMVMRLRWNMNLNMSYFI